VLGGLGNLIGDWAASGSEQNELLRVEVDHVEEGFEADTRIALK